MDRILGFEKMINSLEANGEIEFYTRHRRIYIHSIDGKEGYSYVTPSGQEFDSSKGAVEWAINELHGVENITTWS
jgi:hypothetical protein